MHNFFPLAIFPEGSLASSIITTVWVGIAVVIFFNQRFGWVLSGLVIPGYLVPLFLSRPASAIVVVGEGLLTYGLVWFYSEHLTRRFGWSNFFGRDRFFAIVVCSVLVRVLADGFLLPAFGEWMNHTFHIHFDYRNNLHSFGLVIGALIANSFWKTGWRSGLVQLFVTVGITLLIVRFVLMTITNFNITSLSYLYEDVAASILASPKSYIILLVTAFFASRMNLLYGWDFAGILIPSLLALQWYQPEKILTTIIETTIILLVVSLVLRLKYFRGATIEGGRKILLFFNISYLYKFLLAYVLIWFFPEQKITDMYGFGYLLPTLIAVKMHEKGIHARMTRTTLQTSLLAAICATLLGFGLTRLPDIGGVAIARKNSSVNNLITSNETLTDVVRNEQLRASLTRFNPVVVTPTPSEIRTFSRAMVALGAYRKFRSNESMSDALALLGNIGFRLEILEDRYLILREKLPRHYWGLYVIDLQAKNNLAIEVPAPLDEHGTAEAGAWLMRKLDAQTLAISGSLRTATPNGRTDVLLSSRTVYQTFHESFGLRGTLQIRAHASDPSRRSTTRTTHKPEISQSITSLWIKNAAPDTLDLNLLKNELSTIHIQIGEVPLQNLQRETMHTGFAELHLNAETLRRILAKSHNETGKVIAIEDRRGIVTVMNSHIQIADTESNLYRKPTSDELAYLEGEVIAPILRAIHQHHPERQWKKEGAAELYIIHTSASFLGYSLERYRDQRSGNDFVILAESDKLPRAARRHWGSFVFSAGRSSPYIVQVPQPIHEIGTLEFSENLFELLNAKALLIAGSRPDTNTDQSANVLNPDNKSNLFNTVEQALLRSAGLAPRMTLQIRAIANNPDQTMSDAGVLITTTRLLQKKQMGLLGQHLLNIFDQHDIQHNFAGSQLMGGCWFTACPLSQNYAKQGVSHFMGISTRACKSLSQT